MTNTQSPKDNWKHLDTFIAALTGVGISEAARHMIQYDHVPWWRVVFLIVTALIGGGVVAVSFYKYPLKTAPPNDSENSNPES